MILANSRKMFARKLTSRKACRATRSENASRPLVLVYCELCVRLYVIFIALEIMESELTFYGDNFCKFHVLYACTSDACTLETRRRFVTERERKKKESRNFNPGLTAWVINLCRSSLFKVAQNSFQHFTRLYIG